MRLLHCIQTADPACGGPIEGIKQFASSHQKRGHAVEVATLDLPSDDWVKEFPLPLHTLGKNRSVYGRTPAFVSWLKQNRSRFDAVIVDGLWRFHGRGVWLALQGTTTPYFVFTHGMLDPWFKHNYPLKHLQKYVYWLWTEYRLLRDASAVLFTCEEERRLARQSFRPYSCREQVINFGTASPLGDPTSQKEMFFEKFPALRGKRILLFLGRLHEKKGCDLLIKAYAQIAAETADNDYCLVMAGPLKGNECADTLMKLADSLGLAGNSIVWTGALAGDFKWGAFHASEAFVLPSHQENFGIAVVEALACGIPVLISSQVNIWREISEDGAGLVESDNLEGTILLLRRWLKLDSSERNRMRVSARRCFAQRFEIGKAAESLISALRRSGVTENESVDAGMCQR